ncbi:MAG TPA: hypothetical protein VKV26_24205 [Dehalococcoidia bacterium]|nr:hypothetical protein [Dehalococcoidia bacterium]
MNRHGRPNVTLDTCSLLDLEEGRPAARPLGRLIGLHRTGALRLGVVVIGGCVRRPDGVYAADLTAFRERITMLDLGEARRLRPLFRWGLSFAEWSQWPTPAAERLERRIHRALFPAAPFRWGDCADAAGPDADRDELYARWREARLTVLSVWAHIEHAGDIYVTRDETFWQHGAAARLRALGAGAILTPRDAALRLGGHGAALGPAAGDA